MPNPLVLRIALSRSCAAGEHDCTGDAGGVPCSCLCHRTIERLEADAGGMLTEHLAQRGIVDALDRIAAYIDARFPGRLPDDDLLDHLTRGLADHVAQAVDTVTEQHRLELQAATRLRADALTECETLRADIAEAETNAAVARAGLDAATGPVFVAILLTGRGYFVAVVDVAHDLDDLGTSTAIAEALSTSDAAAYVDVYDLSTGRESDPVLTLRAPAPDDTSPPNADAPVLPAAGGPDA